MWLRPFVTTKTRKRSSPLNPIFSTTVPRFPMTKKHSDPKLLDRSIMTQESQHALPGTCCSDRLFTCRLSCQQTSLICWRPLWIGFSYKMQTCLSKLGTKMAWVVERKDATTFLCCLLYYQVPPGVYHEVDWSLDSPTSKYVYKYIYIYSIYIFPYCIRVQVFSSSLSTTHIVSGRSFIFTGICWVKLLAPSEPQHHHDMSITYPLVNIQKAIEHGDL